MNERITAIRKYYGLTQEEFGKQIGGLSRNYVWMIEKGDRVPSERTIRDICREYNVNYLWLTEGKGDMFTTTPESVVDELAEDFKLDEMDKKIIEKYLELSDEQRAVIKQYLKSIFE